MPHFSKQVNGQLYLYDDIVAFPGLNYEELEKEAQEELALLNSAT
jgi:hypothetical protein